MIPLLGGTWGIDLDLTIEYGPSSNSLDGFDLPFFTNNCGLSPLKRALTLECGQPAFCCFILSQYNFRFLLAFGNMCKLGCLGGIVSVIKFRKLSIDSSEGL